MLGSDSDESEVFSVPESRTTAMDSAQFAQFMQCFQQRNAQMMQAMIDGLAALRTPQPGPIAPDSGAGPVNVPTGPTRVESVQNVGPDYPAPSDAGVGSAGPNTDSSAGPKPTFDFELDDPVAADNPKRREAVVGISPPPQPDLGRCVGHRHRACRPRG